MTDVLMDKFESMFDIIERSEKYNYWVCLSKDKKTKIFRSPNYNYNFNLETGKMVSWGKTIDDDPERAPVPNILDLECTTICGGIHNIDPSAGKTVYHPCPFCYKSNSFNGKNLSFDDFKKIIDVQSKGLSQLALGADADLTSNPDIWKMMEYCRSQNIIPNVTAAQVDDETADKLAKYCGAVAISRYDDKDICYDSIKRLTDRGMNQVNMHYMIAAETYDRCMETLNDIITDSRLAKLNAIVLLSLKTKGRGVGFHPLSQDKFDTICKFAVEHNIGLGFDSCSSLKVIRSLGDSVKDSVIPCESSRESSYISVDGKYYPCSFAEGEGVWKEGLNVLDCNSTEEYLDKVWYNPKTLAFSEVLEETCSCNEHNCRTCPLFEV